MKLIIDIPDKVFPDLVRKEDWIKERCLVSLTNILEDCNTLKRDMYSDYMSVSSYKDSEIINVLINSIQNAEVVDECN